MKGLKLAIRASLVICCMAFIHDKRKPTALTTYYYKSNNDYQRVEYGHTIEADLREQSIEANGGAIFTDITKWQTTLVAYTWTSDMSKYIAEITFNLDAVNPADGGTDGDLTLQEALDHVYARYTFFTAMPFATLKDNALITIEAATAVH